MHSTATSKRCTSCGSASDPNAAFCGECGQAAAVEPSSAARADELGHEPVSAHAARTVESLRARLLDLTARNRLLNCSHKPGKRDQIRVVDELPDFLYERLRDKQELTFRPLPHGDDAELAGSNPDEIALKYGIDPSYDLPGKGTASARAKHSDLFIQTLLGREQLEGQLRVVREKTNSALNETGVNTLYAAFGFLEWSEHETPGSKRFLSPLLLLPLELKRTLARGQYDYSIVALDDEPQSNPTLEEKLQRDFQVVLPRVASDDSPELYFTKMQPVLAAKPGWRLRRFVTVSNFQFARLAMYRDLEGDAWSEGMTDHPVLRRVLAGSTSATSLSPAPTYDFDDPQVAPGIPPAIWPADSSQMSAIVDVLAGKNLVLKGPPGTGKSQTITNILAAAMDQGKSVLFVAEKMAALDVVKRRMEQAGLGAFCLELHSTKSQKTRVMSALAARLDLQRGLAAPAHFEAKAARARDLMHKLTEYAAQLNRPFGSFGETVHRILWTEQATRDWLNAQPRRVRELDVRNVTSLRLDQYERWQEDARELEEHWREMVRDSSNPWDLINGRAVAPAAASRILDRAGEWNASLVTVMDAVTECGMDALTQGPDELRASSLAATALSRLLPLDAGYVESALMLAPEDAGLVTKCAAEIRGCVLKLRASGVALAAVEALATEEPQIAAAAQVFQEDDARVAELKERLADMKAAEIVLIEVASRAERASRLAGFKGSLTLDDVALIKELANLVEAAPRDALLARCDAAADEQNARRIRALAARIAVARARHAELSVALDLEALDDTGLARGAVVTLRNTNWLTALGSDARAAKRLAMAVARGNRASRTALAALLESAVDHLVEAEGCVAEIRSLGLPDGLSRGIDTDVDSVVDWLELYRRLAEVAGASPVGVAFLDFVRQASLRDLDVALRMVGRECPELPELPRGLNSRSQNFLAIVDSYRAALERICRAAFEIAPASDASVGDLLEVVRAAATAQRLTTKLRAMPALSRLPISLSLETSVLEKVERAAALRTALEAPGLVGTVHSLRQSDDPGALVVRKVADGQRMLALLKELEVSRTAFFVESGSENRSAWSSLAAEHAAASRLLEHRDALVPRLRFLSARARAGTSLLADVVDGYVASGSAPPELFKTTRALIYRGLARAALEAFPTLATASGAALEESQRQLRDLDADNRELTRQAIAAKLVHRVPPSGNSAGPKKSWTEAALIRNEISKKKQHIPIRELLARAPEAIRSLTPCLMMSPLSVSQLLPREQAMFDLVIFDEASQMRPEDALGAIVRGKQFVVVGDPEQLPPTSFFRRMDDESDEWGDGDDGSEDVAAESILDMARTAFYPPRSLLWHYRSRHESLIRFSNYHFYDGRLQIFPAPSSDSGSLGVTAIAAEGEFLDGTNAIEAQKVVEQLLAHVRAAPERSCGIVAVNRKQTELIDTLVDEAARNNTELEDYRLRWGRSGEPFFVKNLENVQGDERDTIMISLTYGPVKRGGPVPQRFGPINSADGYRRLNVLFTRARMQTVVITSMSANDVKASENSRRGVITLRDYLTYASTGELPRADVSGAGVDSPFEEHVMSALRARGYDVTPQIGVSGFYIDLGIKHPDYPHGFLCGVECDGATYHSSRWARDRDVARQQILEGLGWTLFRVWSTDWFHDPRRELQRLDAGIRAFLSSKVTSASNSMRA